MASVSTRIRIFKRSISTTPAMDRRWCSTAAPRRCGGGGVGWPGFAAVAGSSGGGRFVAPIAEEIARIRAKHPFLKPLTIPAGSYPGQDTAIASVGSWSFILARRGLGDDVAYRLARGLHRGEAALAARLPQARETTAANTLAAAPRVDLIHPGVRRYLSEIGLAN
jgi:uncharacterized protein